MNGFIKRLERVRTMLEGQKQERPTLVYADGFQQSMDFMEAVSEVCKRDDVVGVLSRDETTRSLLLAMRGPWDFSDVEELAGE